MNTINNHPQKRSLKFEFSIAFLLIAIGVVLRVLFLDIPNFAPIAALALLSGFWFQRKSIALTVPMFTMLISDCIVGGYELGMMFAVYGCFMIPVWFGTLSSKIKSGWQRAIAVSVSTIGGSLLFFCITNLTVWFNWYAITWEGFVTCYAAAIPFFKYTLLGDIFFSASFFTTLIGLRILSDSRSSRSAVEIQHS